MNHTASLLPGLLRVCGAAALCGLLACSKAVEVAPAGESGEAGAAAIASAPPAPAPAAAKAPVEVAAAGARPPKLETGFDLSSIRLPVTASATPHQHTEGEAADAHAHDATPGAAPAHEGPFGLVGFAHDEEQSHDFGELTQGAIGEHTFVFKSAGEAALVLDQIKPSCGCTVAQTMLVDEDGGRTAYQPGLPIPIGTTVELSVKLNTQGKRGPLHSVINLMCNDARQTVALSLKADVKTFLDIEPPSLNFTKMRTDETREGVFVITSGVIDRFALEYMPFEPPLRGIPEAPDAALAGHMAGADDLQVELVPIEPDAEGRSGRWEARVALGPNLAEGQRTIPFTLRSDVEVAGAPPGEDGAPARHQAVGYVVAYVTGLVDVEPLYMSFGLVRPGQVMSRSVTVKNYDASWSMPLPTASLTFLNAFAHADKLSVSVRPIVEGREFEVVLTIDGLPDGFTGSVSGRIAIETGHPSKPRVEVAFSGICRSVVATAVPAPPVVPEPPVAEERPGADGGR